LRTPLINNLHAKRIKNKRKIDLFPLKCFSEKNNKFYASLLKANIFLAKISGVLMSNIHSLNLCTKENKMFFSYRRDGKTGRMISGIMLS